MIGAPLGGMVLKHLGGAYVWGGCLAVGLLSALIYHSIRGAIAVKPKA